MTSPPEPATTRFGGVVFCHAPADRRFDLGALARPADDADRWSVAGSITAYLASSAAVAAAEWARHAGGGADDRTIVALVLRSVLVLDLRTDAAPAGAFLDRDAARRAAARALASGVAGLLVPSMAFLERAHEAFNVVLFCERLPTGLGGVLSEPRTVGRIRLAAPPRGAERRSG
jgi:hypothetical protein